MIEIKTSRERVKTVHIAIVDVHYSCAWHMKMIISVFLLRAVADGKQIAIN
jgi:hypothetical protein